MNKEDLIVKRYGKIQELATEVVAFLKEKDVTYKEALKALEDAQSFLKWTSLKNKL